MAHKEDKGLPKDKTDKRQLIFLFLLIGQLIPFVSSTTNPHQVKQVTWTLSRTLDGHIVRNITLLGSQTQTERPSFLFDFCDLLQNDWDQGTWSPGWEDNVPTYVDCSTFGCHEACLQRNLAEYSFYICPAGNENCGDMSDFYCKNWGCETMWGPDPETQGKGNDLITFQRYKGPGINPINLTILPWITRNPKPTWFAGKTWGLRLYKSGYDVGILFTIQRFEHPVNPSIPIRPNQVLNPYKQPVSENQPTKETFLASLGNSPRRQDNNSDRTPLRLVSSAYQFLNSSHPELVSDCWLCLDPRPPYYSGVGAQANIGPNETQVRNLTAEQALILCPWGTNPILTLGELSGTGTCFTTGNKSAIPVPYDEYCNETLVITASSSMYLVPPKGTWFACKSGMTPCLNPHVLDETSDFCILVHLLPQVYYYSGDSGREHFYRRRVSREFVTASILVPLLVTAGIAGSASLGAAALVKNDMNFKELSCQIDRDLSELQKSVEFLSDSHESLAEVVLQNRRGLDLLFLQQGGLCMGLGEQCCFYANNSGVIKESLGLVKQRLREREKTRKESSSWWINISPWLTTLLSAIGVPLILLLIALTCGPRLLNLILQNWRLRSNSGSSGPITTKSKA